MEIADKFCLPSHHKIYKKKTQEKYIGITEGLWNRGATHKKHHLTIATRNTEQHFLDTFAVSRNQTKTHQK